MISVKLYLLGGKNIRRFSIGDAIPATFEALVQTSRQLLGEEGVNIPSLVFKYQDNEGDWITVASEIEFKEAIRCNQASQLLRIKVLAGDKKPEEKKPEPKKPVSTSTTQTAPFTIPNLGKNDVVVDITDSLTDVLPAQLQAMLGTGTTQIDKAHQVAHPHVTCDGCNQHPLMGTRYKCKDCKDFDLCGACYKTANKIHNAKHTFFAIPFPRNHRFGNVVTHIVYENDKKPRKAKKAKTTQPPVELKTELAPASLVDQQAPLVTAPVFAAPVVEPVAPPALVVAPPVVEPKVVLAPVVPKPVEQPAKAPEVKKKDTKYALQLEILKEMGFSNEDLNAEMLNKFGGNMQRVVEEFFNRGA